MKSRFEIISEYCEKAGRPAFSANNRWYEGYIVDITPERIEFYSGGPMSDGKPIYISLESIDLDSLLIYEDDTRETMRIRWDERENKWVKSAYEKSSAPVAPVQQKGCGLLLIVTATVTYALICECFRSPR